MLPKTAAHFLVLTRFLPTLTAFPEVPFQGSLFILIDALLCQSRQL